MTEQTKRLLLTMAKQPAPGQTKTRLTPPLTPERAAALYEAFLKDTIALMRRVPEYVAEVQLVLAYAPLSAKPYFTNLAPTFALEPQQGHDLGDRLAQISKRYLAAGYNQVVLMDSDSPTLPLDHLVSAFKALDEDADIVLGPCADGGYYLIGLTRPAPRLFQEVQMSTPQVLADTLALAKADGLRTTLLPQWYDVDDSISLARLTEELHTAFAGVAPHTRAFLRVI